MPLALSTSSNHHFRRASQTNGSNKCNMYRLLLRQQTIHFNKLDSMNIYWNACRNVICNKYVCVAVFIMNIRGISSFRLQHIITLIPHIHNIQLFLIFSFVFHPREKHLFSLIRSYQFAAVLIWKNKSIFYIIKWELYRFIA